MAQRVHIVLEDDVDGSTAEESVKFSLDNVSYEIDLSSANAAKLRDALAPWIGHARRVGGRRTTARKGRGNSDANEIRSWAQSQGIEVSSRGRIPADVRAAYEAAQG